MKCCDRCKKPIDPSSMINIKFTMNYKRFIKDIVTVMQRIDKNEEDAFHYNMRAKGKFELCEDCTVELAKWLHDKEKNKK